MASALPVIRPDSAIALFASGVSARLQRLVLRDGIAEHGAQPDIGREMGRFGDAGGTDGRRDV